MPNHITTIIKSRPARAHHGILLNADKEVDFNRVIPTPPNVYQGPIDGSIFSPGNSWAPAKDWKTKKIPDDYDPELHTDNWYTWNSANWGTKWNAYSTELRDNDVIKFETAWAHPTPVIQALTKEHPDIVFDICYASEDTGFNLGVYQVHGVHQHSIDIEEGTPAAVKLACIIRHDCLPNEWYEVDDYYEDSVIRASVLSSGPTKYDPFDLITSPSLLTKTD